MNKLVRLLLVLFMLSSSLTINTVSANAASGGPVVLLGIDAEDGGLNGHGPITVYQQVGRSILSNVRNGRSGMLVIGGQSGGFVTSWWGAVANGMSQPVTFVYGSAISSVNFDSYAIVGVSSDFNNTPGGLTQADNDRLSARSADIANFVNNGGGLFGLAASGFTNPYGYLGGVGSFQFNFPAGYQNITPTADGIATGINDSLDVCCWHDEYVEFPNFLKVLANSPLGRPAAIGGANVFISSIQLEPNSASLDVGLNHTVTATIEENGKPVANRSVSFNVLSGPHAGTTSSATTNSAGRASFTYTGTRSGVDSINATVVNSRGTTESSNVVTVTWLNQPPSVNAGADVVGNEGAGIVLSGSAFDPEGASLSYAWSYTPVSGVSAGATCAFSAANDAATTITCTDNGVYRARLTVNEGVNTPVYDEAMVTVYNVAPVADFTANNPVNEGGSIGLSLANASDPSSTDRNAGLNYAFDCGAGNGYQSSATASVACPTDDNGTRTVKARISDKDGGFTEYTATSNILNVAPTATLSVTTPVNEGSSFTVALSDAQDPSSVDTTAGFRYTFDCGSGYGSTGTAASAACPTDDNGTRTVKARISDKDGGFTEYTTTSSILNVAPTATLSVTTPVNEGSSFTVALSDAQDPSSVDTTAGFRYTFNCDDGRGFVDRGATASLTCPTDDNGTRTVKARISDKDGGFTEYTAQVIVNNVAPTATLSVTTPVNEGSNFTVALSDAQDPSRVDTTAGFRYMLDCDDGRGFVDPGASASMSCPTFDNGTRTILARVSDKDGGFTEYTAQVIVNNVAPVVGPITAPVEPQRVNTAITVSSPFTDPGTADTHTAQWEWGDGSTSVGTVTAAVDGKGSVQDSHTYTNPGVYTIKLTVTDDDGGVGSTVFQYVVIYDPNGGFVTGGGWITSPAGAYIPNPSLSGRANFGFVSKYRPGATVPTGQTEFQFKAGGLNFHSSSYEWLVVGGPKAQYKGVGTINGTGNYGFMLTVIDGAINGGGGVDKFRLKIWDKATGNLVYDNQKDGATDANPTMAIDNGNIVIHER